MTVSTLLGSKTANLGRMPEKLLAEILLKELFNEGKA